MSRRVDTVLVVGRDAPGWIAALALRRALGRTGVRVQLLELPSLLQPIDVYTALPALHALNQLLGLQEAEVLAASAGVPVMGQRFSNWAKSRPPFLVGYDTPTPTGAAVGFIHYWLKARAQGLRVDYEDFSLAAAAAKQGRLPTPDGVAGPLSAAPGYHLDARGYADLLRRKALQSGVERLSGRVAEVTTGDGRIAGVELVGGERLEADLFVDASGSEAALIGRLDDGFSSWSEWLPCDRMLAASGPALPELPGFSEIAAFKAGWIGLHPLQDRIAVVACYGSGDCSDDEAIELLPIVAGIRLEGDAFVTTLRPGLRERPWIGNCVALGEAAASLDPLDAVPLHLVHVAVSHLVTLFPADADNMLEAVAYNRALAAHACNVRDFQAAHYKLNRRYDESFWDRVRRAPGPEALDDRIRVFAARGLVPLLEEETFQEQSWSAMLIGHGTYPASYDPRVDLLSADAHIDGIQQRLRDIASEVRNMPTIAAYLAAAQTRR